MKYKVRVLITKELDEDYGTDDILNDEELNGSQQREEIINLVKEDIAAFLDDAEWDVEVTLGERGVNGKDK